jgi:hypothetical protein
MGQTKAVLGEINSSASNVVILKAAIEWIALAY